MGIDQDLDLWNTLTGAELLQAIGEGRFPEFSHVALHIRQKIVRAEPGRVEISWSPHEDLCNPGGTVHGGYIALIMDNAVCMAGASTLHRYTPMLTMSLSIDYIRPVQVDATYQVVGTCEHPGRTRMLSTATITDADGKLAARATASVTPNQAFGQR